MNIEGLDIKSYELSLFCDEKDQPEFVRCRIPGLEEKAIPESLLPDLQSLIEHLLSSLRLSFRMDVMLAGPHAAWSFFPEGQPHSMSLLIKEFDTRVYDPQQTKGIFVHTFNIRELMRLYVDGVDIRIPLQYRFLSLYRILENKFRHRGRWNKGALEAYLAPHSNGLRALGFRGTPSRIIHDLRDRCTHIRTGQKGAREVLGVTHLNHREAVRVARVLPFLRSVGATIINERTDGKFTLITDVVEEGLQKVAGGGRSVGHESWKSG